LQNRGGIANARLSARQRAQPDLQESLGRLEIKPEAVRFTVCSTRDLIEDASLDVESWLFQKISEGMNALINEALVIGAGIGKPLGPAQPAARHSHLRDFAGDNGGAVLMAGSRPARHANPSAMAGERLVPHEPADCLASC
jgi:HK97 family phage major capsid protein